MRDSSIHVKKLMMHVIFFIIDVHLIGHNTCSIMVTLELLYIAKTAIHMGIMYFTTEL
jgi:hypothetical protein